MLAKMIGWLFVLRINVALAVFQRYRDLEAGDPNLWNSSGETGYRTPDLLLLKPTAEALDHCRSPRQNEVSKGYDWQHTNGNFFKTDWHNSNNSPQLFNPLPMDNYVDSVQNKIAKFPLMLMYF